MSIVKVFIATSVGVLLTIPPEVNEYIRKIDPTTRVAVFYWLRIPGDVANAIVCDIFPGMRVTESGFLMKGVTDWIATGINVLFFAALVFWADFLTKTSDTGLRRTSLRLAVFGSIPFLLGLVAFRFLPSFVKWLNLPETEPTVQTGDLLAIPVLIVTFIGGLLAAVGLAAEVLRLMRRPHSSH